MANPDLIILGATISPLVVTLASRVSIRIWQQIQRRRFELKARSALVRSFEFRAISRRSLATHIKGLSATVKFGSDCSEVGWGPARVATDEPPRAPRTRRRGLNSKAHRRPRTLATIDIECAANLPVRELSVEIFPPVPLRGRRPPLKGPADLTYALLEMPLARQLLEGERVHWGDGRLQIRTCEIRPAKSFVALVNKAAEVAAYLEQRGVADVEKRLVDEALFLRCTESRLRAIRLIVDLPDSPLIRSALHRLAADDDPVVQLNAARSLGRDGQPTLRAIAENGRVPETIRVGAIDALAAEPDEPVAALFERLLNDNNVEIARLALRRLCEVSGPSALPAVREAVLQPTAKEELVLTAIEVFNGVELPLVVGALHQLTDRGSTRVRRAAVELIGRKGELASLAPLTRLLRQRTLPLSLMMSVETAIALLRIRHRADAGRLSIDPAASDVPLGALSPPPSTGLSVAQPSSLSSGSQAPAREAE